MTTTIATTFVTASLAEIKSFLAANDAAAGLASAMKFDGWKMAEVRSYADRVQALRAAGCTSPITPSTVVAVEQQLADDRAAAEAAEAAKQAPAPAAPVDVLFEALAELSAADLLAQVEAQVAMAAKGKAKRTTQTVVSDRFVEQMKATLAKATAEGDMLVVGAATLLECGWSMAYTTRRTGWSKNMNGGMAARQLGYAAQTRADAQQPGGFVVVLRRAA